MAKEVASAEATDTATADQPDEQPESAEAAHAELETCPNCDSELAAGILAEFAKLNPPEGLMCPECPGVDNWERSLRPREPGAHRSRGEARPSGRSRRSRTAEPSEEVTDMAVATAPTKRTGRAGAAKPAPTATRTRGTATRGAAKPAADRTPDGQYVEKAYGFLKKNAAKGPHTSGDVVKGLSLPVTAGEYAKMRTALGSDKRITNVSKERKGLYKVK